MRYSYSHLKSYLYVVDGPSIFTSSVCHGKQDGTYADKADCTRYYHCSNGLPYRMQCSTGTVWNDRLKGCSFTYYLNSPCSLPTFYKRFVATLDQPDTWEFDKNDQLVENKSKNIND